MKLVSVQSYDVFLTLVVLVVVEYIGNVVT
jgi:hypothetical protein